MLKRYLNQPIIWEYLKRKENFKTWKQIQLKSAASWNANLFLKYIPNNKEHKVSMIIELVNQCKSAEKAIWVNQFQVRYPMPMEILITQKEGEVYKIVKIHLIVMRVIGNHCKKGE